MVQTDPDPSAQAILDFWFGAAGSDEFGKRRSQWFTKSDSFDASIREQFGSEVDAALNGDLDSWPQSGVPRQTLAYILLLDQFTRNIFRDTPAMFAGDDRALTAAQSMVSSGEDLHLLRVERVFCYLPYEHSEDLAMQRESMRLMTLLAGDSEAQGFVDYAQRHFDIVERFGRFPHRNATLQRQSTAEEVEFLKQPGSGF